MTLHLLTADDRDLAALADAFFGDNVAGSDAHFMVGPALEDRLWSELGDLGLTTLAVPGEEGGGGATLRQALIVVASAARFGLHVPVAEHDLLAGWLLRQPGGITGASSSLDTVAYLPCGSDAAVVPWGAQAETVLLVRREEDVWHGVRLAPSPDSMTPIDSGGAPAIRLAGIGNVSWQQIDPSVGGELLVRGALLRATQCAAAMETIVAMSIEHAHVRHQFGRPLARFQAVQHLLTDMAAESALADAVVNRAVDAFDGAEPADRAVALAKSCIGDASEVVVRAAHQLHGAIGTTREHRLHRFTGAVYTWRSDFGGAPVWQRWLSRQLATSHSPADRLWEVITGTAR